jgi:hypothetical protein
MAEHRAPRRRTSEDTDRALEHLAIAVGPATGAPRDLEIDECPGDRRIVGCNRPTACRLSASSTGRDETDWRRSASDRSARSKDLSKIVRFL